MTPKRRSAENRTWQHFENGGFFNEKPHLLLEAIYQYNDDDKTELCQQIVITDQEVKCYMCSNHYFTKEQLLSEIHPIGFSTFKFYDDIAGKEYSGTNETICAIFTK